MSDPSPPPPSSPDLTGRRLGDFQLLRKLGQGGMGQVYLAKQLSLKRQVAVKILRDDHADNPTSRARFQAEAEAVARISHPNIVQVYAVGEDDGIRYMALEYVDGRTLRDHLDRKGPPDLPVAVAILRQVAAALQQAAELGLVHRDIKPENILVTRKVQVKVTDFGLSRYVAGDGQPLSLTQSGMTVGTPLYMAPEQVQGKAVDHRTDLYSLGVTAYHLLAGFPPFTGATAFDVAVKHVQQEPEPLALVRPDLPPELCRIVHRLMAKNPADRYATAKEVSRELAGVLKGLSAGGGTGGPLSLNVTLTGATVSGVSLGASSAPGTLTAVPREPGRWPWRVAGVAAVLAAFAGGWWAFGRASQPDTTPTASAGPGLPELKLPTPLMSARETALRDQWRTLPPHTRPQLEAGLALALLCLSERRLDDAERVFAEMNTPPPRPVKPGEYPLPVSAAVLAKFGRAVVLAHRDQAEESVKLFADAIAAIPKKDQQWLAVEKLCFTYPEFGHAIGAAVNRDAENLPKGTSLPTTVARLRNPAALLSGPK
jgi:tRNA A-37 threonylcarbamoyl transferase component Bud32